MDNRRSWDSYFMAIAREVATRATCPRRSVGAVIVHDRRILATGYNGSVRGALHCTEAGCLMEGGHCVRTVHAEANAVLQVGRVSPEATLYTTASPCWACAKLVANAGIKSVVYGEAYPDNRFTELFTSVRCS
jgi:dCMP deaminase